MLRSKREADPFDTWSALAHARHNDILTETYLGGGQGEIQGRRPRVLALDGEREVDAMRRGGLRCQGSVVE
jgi:hypothetical protein